MNILAAYVVGRPVGKEGLLWDTEQLGVITAANGSRSPQHPQGHSQPQWAILRPVASRRHDTLARQPHGLVGM